MTKGVTVYYLSEIHLILSNSDLSNDFEKSKITFQREVPKRLRMFCQSETNTAKKHKSIRTNSSPLRVKLRMISFLIANRLYASKIKKLLLGSSYQKTGQTLYDNELS